MADPFSDQDHGPGGASKRPAQTIEGTATEISEEAAGGDAAHEAETAGDHPDIAGEAPHGVDAALPPAQASLPELKSFVTHLAAGVLGGLVGVVGLALAWGGLGGGGSSGPQPDIAALEARIAKLETAPPASGDGEALAQLKAQVETLETGVKETSPKLADLADRVGQLETSLRAISQSASDGGSVASAAAIAQQIAEAEQRLDAKLADALAANASSLQEMQSAIAELKAKIGALAELGTGNGAAAGPALAARLARLEAAMPELAAAIGKENNGAKSAAAAIAFANLRAAVSDGRPYATELDTIGALVPSVGDLGVLPAYAEKGIPTAPDLARTFVVAKEGAQVATAPASSGSLVDTLMASAQSLVTIKRLDEPTTGQGPGAALARAKAALDQGDLAAAVKEVETLDGASREAFAAWLGQAHARLSADETLIQLESTLLVSVGSNPQAPRQHAQ
ncbi:MAG TPA: mitofilin family membrane protein [Methyloceanibacter sp.]